MADAIILHAGGDRHPDGERLRPCTGRHPIWYSPKSNCNFPVPTHIKSRHTANQIMKQAGISHKV